MAKATPSEPRHGKTTKNLWRHDFTLRQEPAPVDFCNIRTKGRVRTSLYPSSRWRPNLDCLQKGFFQGHRQQRQRTRIFFRTNMEHTMQKGFSSKSH